jgi:phosphohistidine phosphatase
LLTKSPLDFRVGFLLSDNWENFMKNLYILRHAKSNWSDGNQTDFERPLNKRGLRTAPKMGALMREKGFVPDLILSSTAVRARTTAEIVRAALQSEVKICFDVRIYNAATRDLLEVLSQLPDAAEKVMLVGHNPELENLIFALTGETITLPTAALAEIELPLGKWMEIARGGGKLKNTFYPRKIFQI